MLSGYSQSLISFDPYDKRLSNLILGKNTRFRHINGPRREANK